MEKAAILIFPQGIPGFENERRFAAIQIPGQHPLLYLQSVATPELCLLTLPIQAIHPSFKLQLQQEDRQSIQSDSESANLVTLAIVTADQDGNATINLAAPLVVNSQNNLAVQALQTDPSLSYQHPLPSRKQC